VQKPTDDRALARLRIFTTQTELKLAGHPVIGTWFLLAELGVVPAQEGGVHILQQDWSGRASRRNPFQGWPATTGNMTQKEALFKPLKVRRRRWPKHSAIVEGSRSTMEPTCVSTGIFNLMVPLRNRAALEKIDMNASELRRLIGKNATMAYCFALSGNSKAFTRGMMPWEPFEDAATGSAAGSLGAFLVNNGKLGAGHTLHIQQGVEMGRPSQIEVEVTLSGKN